MKANVLFFDAKPAREKPWTERLWVYDLRTHKHFTLKMKPLRRADVDDFVAYYRPGERHKRKQTWSPENQEGRCRAFKYDEWAKRTTPSADVRHDNIEAIYKTLQNKRDTADVTEVLKELHRIVNEAIRAAAPGGDHAAGRTVDLSQIDFEKLRNEFASKVRRKHAALQDIRDVIEHKLAQMLACNPLRMDYYKKYQAIIADYNREKDRATVEATFAQLVALAASLDTEQRPAAEEGLSDDELALFDLLFKDNIGKKDRERLKQASRSLLSSLRDLLVLMPGWLQNTTTQAEVKVFILDRLYESLPRPPFTEAETDDVALRVYDYVWERSASGQDWPVDAFVLKPVAGVAPGQRDLSAA